MRLKRVFLTGLAAVFVLCGAALLWLFNTDLGRFQPRIQAYLAEQLNREVTMDTLTLELGRTVQLSVTGLSIANASWAGEEPFLSIDRLDGAVDLWSLFSRDPVIVDRLDGNGINLQLAWNKDGAANFHFRETGTTPSSDRSAAPRVMLRGVSLTSSSLDLLHTDHKNSITVATLSLADKTDGMLAATLDGTVNEQPLNFTGELGTFNALLAASQVHFDGSGQFARLNFKGTALIGDLKAPNRPVLDVQISGPDISDIERFLGLEPAVAGAFDAHISSSLEDQAGWGFQVDGKAGEFKLKAEGHAKGLRDLSTLALSAQASGPSLHNMASLFGIKQAPDEPFNLSGSATREGPALAIKDVQLDIGPTQLALSGNMQHFPHVQGSNLKLGVTGPDLAHFRNMLKLPGIAEGPFELSAELSPGNNEEEQLSFRLASQLANIEVNGSLTSDSTYTGSKLRVNMNGKNTAAVLERFSVPGVTASPFTVSADVTVGDGMVTIDNGMITGLYNSDLAVSGDIGYAFFGGKTQLGLRLTGADIDRSLSMLWKNSPARPVPFEIQTQVQASTGQILLKDLELRASQSVLNAAIRIPMKPGGEGLDITFNGNGPNLKAFLRGRLDAGKDYIQVPAQPWDISGQFQKEADHISLTDLRLKVADLNADGKATLAWPLKLDEMSFQLNARGEDLASVVPRIGDFTPASGAFTVDLEGARTGKDWHFEPSRLGFAGAELSLGGEIDGLPDFSSTDFSLAVTVPSLRALGAWDGKPLPEESLGLDARLSGSLDALSFQQLEATIGKSELSGQLTIKPKDERLGLKLQLSSDSLDLRGILPSPEADKPGATPKPDANGFLIPDTPISFNVLTRFDGEAVIDIGGLYLPNRIIDELNLDAVLERGSLVIHRYHSKGLAGDMTATGSLDVLDDGGAAMEVDLRTTDLVPNRQDWKNVDPATLPRFNLSLSGKSSGASLRELAAALNGQIDLVASEGNLPGKGLGELNALLLEQLVNILAPGFKTQQPTRLLCLATRLDVVDGLVSTEPLFVLRTDKILLQSTGTVDLKTERLRLDFQTTPTRLLNTSVAELVNPFVTIKGTLAKPTPVINPTGTLVYGGAAAATGGLSIVAKGLWDRLRGNAKPCEHLREALEKDLAEHGGQ